MAAQHELRDPAHCILGPAVTSHAAHPRSLAFEFRHLTTFLKIIKYSIGGNEQSLVGLSDRIQIQSGLKGFYLFVSDSEYLISVIDPYPNTQKLHFMMSISITNLYGKTNIIRI